MKRELKCASKVHFSIFSSGFTYTHGMMLSPPVSSRCFQCPLGRKLPVSCSAQRYQLTAEIFRCNPFDLGTALRAQIALTVVRPRVGLITGHFCAAPSHAKSSDLSTRAARHHRPPWEQLSVPRGINECGPCTYRRVLLH